MTTHVQLVSIVLSTSGGIVGQYISLSSHVFTLVLQYGLQRQEFRHRLYQRRSFHCMVNFADPLKYVVKFSR